MSRHATAEDLSAYLDRELEPVRLRLVEEHLGECDECRERADGMQRLVRDLRRLERLEPPPVLGRSLHRRIVLQPRSKNLLDRFETRLGGITLQPSVGFTFALVFAFAVILYLFAGSLERQERLRIPVLRPYPPPAAEEVLRQLRSGLTLRREGSLYREVGLPESAAVTEISAADPRARPILEGYPRLGEILREGLSIELEHDGEVVRLVPVEPGD